MQLWDFLDIDLNKLQIIDKKVFNKTTIPKNRKVRRMMLVKNTLPKSIKSRLLFLKAIFFKTYKKEETPKETLNYIKSVLGDDFYRTNKLLNYHFTRGN